MHIGLISIGDLFVMSSEDGQLQTLQATFSENGQILLQVCAYLFFQNLERF